MGLEKLVLALTDLSQHSSRRIVRGAVVRGVEWLCRRLLARLDERTDALVQPAEQVAQRLASLERIVADVEGSMRDLAPVFAAEQRRLGEECRRRREGFLREAGPQARRELAAWMETRSEHGRAFRMAAARQAQELARRHVTAWLTGEQQWAEDAYRRVTQRFASAASAFVSRVSAVDAGVAYAADELDVEEGFTERSRFYFHEYEAIADPASPLRYVTDVIRGGLRARAGIERDVLGFLDLLLEVNSARVESDLSDRIAESRRRLEARILMLLRELGTSARHAVDEATRVRAHGQAATAAALRRLSQLRVEVESLRRSPPA